MSDGIPSGSGYCLNQAFLIHTGGRTGDFPVGEINRPQVAAIVVANSPWAPGHICGVSAKLVVVVVLLFSVLMQGLTR